ncbi:hypothetical protein KXQ82_18985 [Mucilaginibacter sp. HMF5004]|uniref:hypothetical protein n=1 Tax=Mucilaginibacter rivuli TaxID=2857527 RepID=UPI001C5E4414|nr:hypothetical protein [Mucilaginibacter rivuli]MBW4891819.1 hypothetical protein [Mucilaginibacter rivuli]
MMIENPAALQFFMTEDVYLVKQDVESIGSAVKEITIVAGPEPIAVETIPATEAQPIIAETPVIAIPKPVAATEIPVIVAPQSPPIETTKPAFKYLGKNQQRFLIVFHSNGEGKFDDRHFTALTSSLARKELSLDDVAILDLYAYEDTSIAAIAAYFKPDRVMLLGSRCLLPGWNRLKLNTIIKGNAYSALYTYSFDEMMGDKEKVKAFWEQMKNL